MRRKSVSSEMMQDYIVQALLQLLQEQRFDTITIRQLTARAGVDRSTYYRHFRSKEEVVRRYFCRMLEDALAAVPALPQISTEQYLTHIFRSFYVHRKQLLLLHQNGLSYLLLPALNQYFAAKGGLQTAALLEAYALYYHTGGIFNDLLLWFDGDMSLPPAQFAHIAAQVYPQEHRPFLLQAQQKSCAAR